MREFVILTQGIYYAVTGLWALLHIGSFQRVTGPKVDTWLVKTVGALVLVISIPLLMAAVRRRVTQEIQWLAVGSAVAFAAIDGFYVWRGRISKVYLLDLAGELLLLIGMLLRVSSEEPLAEQPTDSVTR